MYGSRNPRGVTQHGFCRVSSSEARGRLRFEIDPRIELNQDETQNLYIYLVDTKTQSRHWSGVRPDARRISRLTDGAEAMKVGSETRVEASVHGVHLVVDSRFGAWIDGVADRDRAPNGVVD